MEGTSAGAGQPNLVPMDSYGTLTSVPASYASFLGVTVSDPVPITDQLM